MRFELVQGSCNRFEESRRGQKGALDSDDGQSNGKENGIETRVSQGVGLRVQG